VLSNPSIKQFRAALQTLNPSCLLFIGERVSSAKGCLSDR
jgi:hypothetical protein